MDFFLKIPLSLHLVMLELSDFLTTHVVSMVPIDQMTQNRFTPGGFAFKSCLQFMLGYVSHSSQC